MRNASYIDNTMYVKFKFILEVIHSEIKHPDDKASY